MRNLKLRLCETVRNFVLETGGKPLIVVHRETCMKYGGNVVNKCDERGFVTLLVSEHVQMKFMDSEIMFDMNIEGKDEKMLIPSISIVAMTDANDQSSSINFDVGREVLEHERGITAQADSVNKIISKLKKVSE